jgi:hypothetical protein
MIKALGCRVLQVFKERQREENRKIGEGCWDFGWEQEGRADFGEIFVGPEWDCLTLVA